MKIDSISNINANFKFNQIPSDFPLKNGTTNNETPPISPVGSDFLTTIIQSLSQTGVGNNLSFSTNGNSISFNLSSTTPSSSQDVTQVADSFLQNLLAALHSQSTQTGNNSSSDSDSDNDGTGNIFNVNISFNGQNDLQNLAQSLALQSLFSTDTSMLPNSTSSILGILDQSFQDLVGVLGSSNDLLLSDFLQSFANNLSGNLLSGNLVNIQA